MLLTVLQKACRMGKADSNGFRRGAIGDRPWVQGWGAILRACPSFAPHRWRQKNEIDDRFFPQEPVGWAKRVPDDGGAWAMGEGLWVKVRDE